MGCPKYGHETNDILVEEPNFDDAFNVTRSIKGIGSSYCVSLIITHMTPKTLIHQPHLGMIENQTTFDSIQ